MGKFRAINWGTISQEIICTSLGGIDSTVYNETLYIQKSGTVDNPILMTKGGDPVTMEE